MIYMMHRGMGSRKGQKMGQISTRADLDANDQYGYDACIRPRVNILGI